MPITAYHSLTMTTPDDPAYENKPSDWNSAHLLTLNAVGSEISNAFGNGGGVSFGLSADGKITAAAPAGGGGLTNINISAGTTSNNLSALTFSNSNGVSFGLNGSVITGSHNGLTTARASNDAIGLNTALTAGPLAWTVNSRGFSLNAGSAAGTTSGFAGNSISGSMTHNTAGLNISLNHPAWLTTAALSNHSHGNPTLNLTNLSGTTASASNGLTLSLSAAAQTVQPVAASGSNGSFAFSTLSFGNLNGMSFYTSNGSIVASYTDGGGGGGLTNINVSAGTTSQNLSALTFDNAGGVSFGLNGSVLTASAPAGGGGGFSAGISNLGNTAGTSGTVGSHIVFVGSGEIALSQSVNGNSATISIYEPTLYRSSYENIYVASISNVFQQPQQSTFAAVPFQVPFDISIASIRMMGSMSQTTTAFATTINTTFSYAQYHTHEFHFFSRNTGANSDSYLNIGSTTHGQTLSVNLQANTAGSQWSISWGLTYPRSSGSATYSASTAVSSASFNYSTAPFSDFIGAGKRREFLWNTSLSGGDYLLLHRQSTTSSTQGTNISGHRQLFSTQGASIMNGGFGDFGAASNSSQFYQPGLGSVSFAGGASTSAFHSSQISSTASHLKAYFALGRIA